MRSAAQPRNARSRSLNGYLTRDGIAPADFLAPRPCRARAIRRRTANRDGARRAARITDGFDVLLETGERLCTRSVLLATGVRDHLPDIPGLSDCYGTSVHHCPYCDGWEVRGRTIAAIGDRRLAGRPRAVAANLERPHHRLHERLEPAGLAAHRRQLAAQGIRLFESPDRAPSNTRTAACNESSSTMTRASHARPSSSPARQSQQCALAEQLGCEFTDKGTVKTDHLGRSCVPGIYVVGDASRDVQFVVVAAAEGAKAGVAINKVLQAQAGLIPATAASRRGEDAPAAQRDNNEDGEAPVARVDDARERAKHRADGDRRSRSACTRCTGRRKCSSRSCSASSSAMRSNRSSSG